MSPPRSLLILGAVLPAGLTAFATAQQSRAIFDAPVVTGTPTSRYEVILDADADGDQDLVSAWWVNSAVDQISVSIALNDGTGGFNAFYGLSLTIQDTATLLTNAVEGGKIDIDHDGRDDFWLAIHGPNKTQVFAFTSNGAATPSVHPLLSTVVNAGSPPAFADFNQDGVLDKAIVEGTTLRIWTIEDVGGNFTPVAQPTVELGLTADHLLVANANDDGTPDLAVNAGGTLFVVPVVAGVPGTPTPHAHGIAAMPMPVVGDIDGDGDEDISVFGMSDYVVLRRGRNGVYQQEPPAVGGPAAKLADVDQDGDLDGICCGGGGPTSVYNSQPSTFRISINDGAGNFAPAFTLPGLGSREIAGAADMDGDGDVDLVAGRCIYYARGPINASNVRPAGPPAPEPRGSYDFDQDGDQDLESPSGLVFQNRADGVLESRAKSWPAAPAGMNFAGPGYPGDFDADGDPDLVVGLFQGATFVSMRLLLNSGGTYADGGDAGAAGVDFRAGPSGDFTAGASVVGDVDQDGDVDLFTLSTAGIPPTSKLWINDGRGRFTYSQEWLNERVEYVGDLGGEFYGAYPDVLTSGYHATVHFGTGVRQWMTGGVAFFTGTNNHNQRYVVEDFDGDGDKDFAYTYGPNGAGAYVEYHDTSTNGWNTTEFLADVDTNNATPRTVVAGDFNGDGQVDVLVGTPRYAKTAVSIHLRRADNTGFEPGILQTVYDEHDGVVSVIPGVARDLDGDGDSDYLTDRWIVNRAFHGDDDGVAVQSAPGTPSASGPAPILGGRGPVRAGQTAEIRLRAAPPHVGGFLQVARSAQVVGPFAPHSGLYSPPLEVTARVPLTTSGTATSPAGSGEWNLPFAVPPYAAGRTLVYWVRLHAAGATPGSSVTSNFLTIHYGF